MRALLIDPKNKVVTEVDYTDWRDINTFVGDGAFNSVRFGAQDAILFVSDTGMMGPGNPDGYFRIAGYGGPLAGKGLLLGCDMGGNDRPLDPRYTRELVLQNIAFIGEPSERPKMTYTTDPAEIARILGVTFHQRATNEDSK